MLSSQTYRDYAIHRDASAYFSVSPYQYSSRVKHIFLANRPVLDIDNVCCDPVTYMTYPILLTGTHFCQFENQWTVQQKFSLLINGTGRGNEIVNIYLAVPSSRFPIIKSNSMELKSSTKFIWVPVRSFFISSIIIRYNGFH